MAVRTYAELAAAALPTACVVKHATTSKDTTGGQTTTYADVATVCRVSLSETPVSAVIADALKGREAYRYSVPQATVIAIGDRVVAGGKTYEVLSAGTGTTLVRGYCAEV